jgi:hypothetical protein
MAQLDLMHSLDGVDLLNTLAGAAIFGLAFFIAEKIVAKRTQA